MIYLDFNATSPYSESVKKFIQEDMVTKWANPSSEYIEAAMLADEIKLMRSFIAETLGCSSKSLVFTSGATESINTILSPQNLKSLGIKRVVTSYLEHHATLDRIKYLKNEGFEIQWLENDSNGVLDLTQLETFASSPDKTLFSFLFINNEIGTINPIKEISSIIHKSEHLIHIDAVQALGKHLFNLEDLDVDFASFSGHKIGAFKGVGLLYSKDIKSLTPLLHGGGQERGYRPGTLNYAAFKSFELALKDAVKWDLKNVETLRDYLEERLVNEEIAVINSKNVPRVVNTSNFAVLTQNSRNLLAHLSRKGIFVSTGSACSSGSFEASHVLRKLGLKDDYARSCLRVSLGDSTTKEDLDLFIVALKEAISNLVEV